jgi:hypothetical protein
VLRLHVRLKGRELYGDRAIKINIRLKPAIGWLKRSVPAGGGDKMDAERLMLKKSAKRKIVFASLMGIVTTGLVSLTVVLVNLGFTAAFWRIWAKSWSVAFLVVVPVILIVAPLIERLVGLLFEERPASVKSDGRTNR